MVKRGGLGMKILIIINDAPYGTEKMFTALRLAMSLQNESPENILKIFLIADAVTAALPNQSVPEGYYNIEKLLKAIIGKGAEVKLCGTCVKARGIKDLKLIEGIEISNMKQLSQWVMDSDKIITF
jgi:uncharacterized protein involved in oxidation of intracellular sulfur